jgi:hypothetical protein
MRALLPAIAAVLSAAAAHAQAATEPRIGSAAVSKNSVTGTLGSSKRSLGVGDPVFQNENIATGADSRAQILFADETALSIGPNSVMQLDRFAYDPDKRSGQLTFRAVTGAFRMVTGAGPKDGYKISTGVGTIGVRGTTIEFVIRGQTLTLALTEGTAILCTLSGQCIELTKPGTYVIATAAGSGEAKSKYGQACGDTGGGLNCTFGQGSDTLFLQYLDLSRFSNLAPGVGPPLPPNNSPPGNPPPPNTPPANTPPENTPPANVPPPNIPPATPPPPVTTGFPPVVTGAGTIPPGLDNRTALPPGLEKNRNESFEPPGQAKRNP